MAEPRKSKHHLQAAEARRKRLRRRQRHGIPRKLSALIQELIEPLLAVEIIQNTEGSAYHELCLQIGVLAWNLSQFPGDPVKQETARCAKELVRSAKREGVSNWLPGDSLDEQRRECAEALEASIESTLQLLIERRRQLFPKDRRTILTYKITDLGEDLHLEVAYATPSKPGEELKLARGARMLG